MISQRVYEGRKRWVADSYLNNLKKINPLKNFLSFSLNSYWYLLYHKYLVQNKKLKNKHFGKKCFILGNGISLAWIDLKKFSDVHTFGCNEIFYHKDFNELNLNFFTVMEPFFSFRRNKKYFEDINNLYYEIDKFFKNKNIKLFFHPSLKKYFEKNHLFLGKDIYYLLSDKYKLNKKSFSYNITKGISFTRGAIFSMIALAAYMGFKEIYLFGCGYTYSPIQLFHFYSRPKISKNLDKYEIEYSIEKFVKESEGLKLFAIEEDVDFIYPIFVKDEPINEFHKEINRYFIGQGVRIFNVVPEGFSSPIYDKISWEEVLLKINKES